jgi:hypothetical protein
LRNATNFREQGRIHLGGKFLSFWCHHESPDLRLLRVS